MLFMNVSGVSFASNFQYTENATGPSPVTFTPLKTNSMKPINQKYYQKAVDLLCQHYQARIDGDSYNQGTMFMCDLLQIVYKQLNKYSVKHWSDVLSMDEFRLFEPTESEKNEVFREHNQSAIHIAYDAWLPMYEFEIRYTILLLCIEMCKSSIIDNANEPV